MSSSKFRGIRRRKVVFFVTLPDVFTERKQSSPSFWRSFGPGLVWAATAIGVSHLVQSTRAGALAGLGLVPLIVLALALKYPLFEIGTRYAAATGESLIDGYGRVGRTTLWLFGLLTLLTAVIVQSAVTLFTVVLIRSLLSIELSNWMLGGGLAAVVAALLTLGHYRALQSLIKPMIILLSLSTVAAALLAAPRLGGDSVQWLPVTTDGSWVSLAFLVALLGWMPSGLDTAAWSSLWTQAQDRSSGARTSVANALLDYRIGYVGTGLLAIAFVVLGAVVLHGGGHAVAAQGTRFSLQLIDLYAETLGPWSRPIIALAALTTMVSTMIAVFDGFPRALDRTWIVARDGPGAPADPAGVGRVYHLALWVMVGATVVVLLYFVGNLTTWIDFATTASFLSAPLLGLFNLRTMRLAQLDERDRPGRLGTALGVMGWLFLTATAVAFLVMRF